MDEIVVMPHEQSGIVPQGAGIAGANRRVVRVIAPVRPAAVAPAAPAIEARAPMAGEQPAADLALDKALARAERQRLIAELRREADMVLIGYAPDPFNFGIW